jgi:hypothetical protein
MPLAGILTPRFLLPNFAETDRPNLAVSPGIPDQLTAIDNAIRYRGALTLAQFATANYGLPTAPVDDDLVTLIVDASNGIDWPLRYVAAEPTYKWRVLGGSDLEAQAINPGIIGVVGSWVADTSTALTIPRPGDYMAEWSAFFSTQSAVAGQVQTGIDRSGIGGAGPVTQPGMFGSSPAVISYAVPMVTRRFLTALAAGTTIEGYFQATTVNYGLFDTVLTLRPRRIG